MSSTKFDPKRDIPDLAGKVILVTGGTAGVGAKAVVELAPHNPGHIVFTGRSTKSANATIESARAVAPHTPVSFVRCDLASLESVKAAADTVLAQHQRLDVLLANAGIMAKPPGLTSDGYELQFGTNHLGHALLIRKLLSLMQKTAQQSNDVRIILVSSTGWRGTPSGGIVFEKLKTRQEMVLGQWLRYGQSKLANVLYAKEIARRYPEVLAFSLTPGVVATDLVGSLGLADRALVYVTNINSVQKPEDGVLNHLWSVSATRDSIKPGAFYEPVGKLSTMTTKWSESAELAKQLWEWTETELEKWM